MKTEFKKKQICSIGREEFDIYNKTYEGLLELNSNSDEDRTINIHLIIQSMSKNFYDYFNRKSIAMAVYKTQCKKYNIIPNEDFSPESTEFFRSVSKSGLCDSKCIDCKCRKEIVGVKPNDISSIVQSN